MLGTVSALAISSAASANFASFMVNGGAANNLPAQVQQTLMVYNTASSDSVAVMEYYCANRPGMSMVDVVGITTATTEQLDYTDVVNQIRTPIRNFIAASPYQKIYIIMCRGIPSRTTGQPAGGNYSAPSVDETIARADPNWDNSVGAEYIGNGGADFNSNIVGNYNMPYSEAEFPGTSFLVTRMDMGSLAATEAYINKLATMYAAMPVPNVVISAAASGNGGTNYVMDDYTTVTMYQTTLNAAATYTALCFDGAYNNISDSRVDYQPYNGTPVTTIANLKGYVSWGVHNGSYAGTYPSDGTLTWSGKSNWYIVSTVESFNGQISGGQGWFGEWFSATGGGGTNYSNTPIGMSCQTDEPLTSGIANQAFYCNWELGMNFAMCAWSSRNAPNDAVPATPGTGGFMAVGDPLVVA